MKSKSAIYFVTGIALGTVAVLLLPSRKNLKSRKELREKSGKYNKMFAQTATKYKEKLEGQY